VSVFTPAEIAYLQSQMIGRIATIGPDGQPHVVPVGFRYNPEQDSIDIGGMAGFTNRKHYRDIVRNPKVAYVVDDLPSVNPWTIRGIEIRGEGEVLTSGGESIVPSFGPDMIRIRAKRIVSWGIASKDAPPTARPATEQSATSS
jgi:pyridoxamine 5'-phosphate oxidase family protein